MSNMSSRKIYCFQIAIAARSETDFLSQYIPVGRLIFKKVPKNMNPLRTPVRKAVLRVLFLPLGHAYSASEDLCQTVFCVSNFSVKHREKWWSQEMQGRVVVQDENTTLATFATQEDPVMRRPCFSQLLPHHNRVA